MGMLLIYKKKQNSDESIKDFVGFMVRQRSGIMDIHIRGQEKKNTSSSDSMNS